MRLPKSSISSKVVSKGDEGLTAARFCHRCGFWGLTVGFAGCGVFSSQLNEPSGAHSLHTTSLAPSIMALKGLPVMCRPQTSHCKAMPPKLFYTSSVLYSCRISMVLLC